MLTESQIDGIVEFDLNDEMSDGRAAQAITQLRAQLAAERELADRTMLALAESRNWNWIDLEDDRGNGVDVDTLLPHLVNLDHEISEILTAHATRRNK